MDQKEIERRKPVWLAISEFYLDTQLDQNDLDRITNIFKTSRYSLSELKDIDFYEVAPIVGRNLLSTAGAWSEFDEEWLWNEIITNRLAKKRNENFLIKIWRAFEERTPFGFWKKIKL